MAKRNGPDGPFGVVTVTTMTWLISSSPSVTHSTYFSGAAARLLDSLQTLLPGDSLQPLPG